MCPVQACEQTTLAQNCQLPAPLLPASIAIIAALPCSLTRFAAGGASVEEFPWDEVIAGVGSDPQRPQPEKCESRAAPAGCHRSSSGSCRGFQSRAGLALGSLVGNWCQKQRPHAHQSQGMLEKEVLRSWDCRHWSLAHPTRGR